HHLDHALELEQQRPTRLVEPSPEGLPTAGRDAVDRSPPRSRARHAGGRQAVSDERLRLFVQLALGPGPEEPDVAPLDLADEVVGRAGPDGEEPEHGVRGGGERTHGGLTLLPSGVKNQSADTPKGSKGPLGGTPCHPPSPRLRSRSSRPPAM